MRLKTREEIQMELEFTKDNGITFEPIAVYILRTGEELDFICQLTNKMASLSRQMRELRYKNVELLQEEFDITYSTLKAMREDNRDERNK
jgi:hypothetical protein